MLFIKSLFDKNNKSIKPFVLTYHRIVEDPLLEPFPLQPGMYVTLRGFEENIKFLKSNFDVIRLEILLEKVFRGEAVENKCAITFDDGWGDNYDNAFKILRRYEVPASIFLTTSLVGTAKWFWFDEVAFFLENADVSTQVSIFSEPSLAKVISRRNFFGDRNTDVVFYLKNCVAKETRDLLLREIRGFNRSIASSKRVMLTWAQVEEMENSGFVQFYPHSHYHENLSDCDREFVVSDLLTSLNVLSEKLKDQAHSKIFCYPSGNVNANVQDLLRLVGFEYALGTKRGCIDISNRYMINRVGIHDDIASRLPKIVHKLL